MARILEEMNDGAAAEFLAELPAGAGQPRLVGAMDADEAVDVLNKFDDEEPAAARRAARSGDAVEINRLLAYPRTPPAV